VFDLGGGTFDVSIVSVRGEEFEVRAVSGDCHLGGDDFDRRIVDYLTTQFTLQNKRNLSGDVRALAKLRKAATQAKIELSLVKETQIEIENLNGTDFSLSLTRARFEDICSDLFDSVLPPLQKVIADSGLEKSEINDIVLVGGSTRIPQIQKIVRDFFDGREPMKNINPDEVVACGAAIHAATLIGHGKDNKTTVIDVTPLSLGTSVTGRKMSVLIPRNTQLPAQGSQFYTTTYNYQTSVLIDVYEGEEALVTENHLLGNFSLQGIERALRGVPEIKVTFSVNKNGVLTVEGVDMRSGVEKSMVIEWNDVGLPASEREAAIARAEKMKDHDQKALESIEACNRFEDFLLNALSKVEDRSAKSPIAKQQAMEELVASGIKWIKEHSQEPAEVIKKEHERYETLVAEVLQKEFADSQSEEL
jgi:L1 cell adhesion molecule like protein